MTSWDKTVDVLVVGSGAGGFVAALAARALGADVLIIEKASVWGGTSATSGGGIWIPNSHLAQAQGITDTADLAFQYVRAQSADNIPDANIRAFIETAPKMLHWVEENSPVRYASIPYTDYQAELPGGKPEGYRSHLPLPLDGKLLGESVLSMRPASPAASFMGFINWDWMESGVFLMRPPGWQKALIRMLSRYFLDLPFRLRSTKDRFLTLGNALLGGLRLAADRDGVKLWLNAPLVDLIREDGRVTGAVVKQDGREMRIQARRGVILSAGGFERNAALRAKYLKIADPKFSGGNTDNTGDTLTLAQTHGIAVKNLDSVWWAPVFSVPGEKRGRLSTVERALPGCIMVNQAGQRYLNEAASYHNVGLAMAEADREGAGTSPSYMIFDSAFRAKYPMGPLLPIIPDKLQQPGVQQIMRKARSIRDLALRTGLPADALEATVRRFNENAARGTDPDFHRGDAAYDRFYGDQRVQPNPNLAPILKPPFYAFPIYAGDIGTNGGIDTDDRARALDLEGRPIAGLYAVGNCAASVMGRSYPGAGSTLGPAMTFGFIAGRDAAGAND